MATTLSTQLLTARVLTVKAVLKSKEYSDQLTRLMTASVRRNKHNSSCAYRKINKQWICVVK